MMELTKHERDPTTIFMAAPGLPNTVAVMLLLTVGGFGGATKGQQVIVTSTVNEASRSSTSYIAESNFLAFGYAPAADFRRTVNDVSSGRTWSWLVDVPSANITNLRVPFEGFVSAANAFESCGSSIGAPF